MVQYPKKAQLGVLNVAHFIQVYTLEEREAPPPEERPSNRDVDPSDYSMNPDAAIANEEFEGDDSSVKSWIGGSTDFLIYR